MIYFSLKASPQGLLRFCCLPSCFNTAVIISPHFHQGVDSGSPPHKLWHANLHLRVCLLVILFATLERLSGPSWNAAYSPIQDVAEAVILCWGRTSSGPEAALMCPTAHTRDTRDPMVAVCSDKGTWHSASWKTLQYKCGAGAEKTQYVEISPLEMCVWDRGICQHSAQMATQA